MLFTEQDVKSGYAKYCRAKEFLSRIESALKNDGLQEKDLPEYARREIQAQREVVRKYESSHT